jgi:hypothetical protein
MTMKQQDTLANWKHTTQSNITTGGLDYEHMSRIMSKDVAPVNNSRLTDDLQNLLLFPQKVPSPQGHSPIVQWTL